VNGVLPGAAADLEDETGLWQHALQDREDRALVPFGGGREPAAIGELLSAGAKHVRRAVCPPR
jgi:hypothetical protein